MAARPPEKGDRIGEYVLEDRIGTGGFGEVWRARHAHLVEKIVAIKIPKHPDTIDFLRREGTIQHSLESESIVQTLGMDLDHEPPYLIMEYVEGEDLRKRIEREAPMPLSDVIPLCREILAPLRFAHKKGVMHRDLKPGNVLLTADRGVKLTDFGLGKVIDASRSAVIRSQTMQSQEVATIVGTLAYMSPEQKSGVGPIDERTDLFAFGVLFFEMLTGELPVGSEVPGDLVKGLDPRADAIYRKACARLESRYASVGEIIKDLRALGRPVRDSQLLKRVSEVQERSWPLKGRWIAMASVIALVLLLGHRSQLVGRAGALVGGIVFATFVVFSLGISGRKGEDIERQIGNMVIFALVVAIIFLG
ncbi:MAG: serine/threonine-protein kinase, partial [Planctomycetota bacterium]|nr:serine/threonine-protein kinase [Planctomycetota bacterium]